MVRFQRSAQFPTRKEWTIEEGLEKDGWRYLTTVFQRGHMEQKNIDGRVQDVEVLDPMPSEGEIMMIYRNGHDELCTAPCEDKNGKVYVDMMKVFYK
tara:strand:- start:1095 stop:1385 length:291 start_codon:yes stop_codon:yes gene_type:complete